MKSSTRKPPTQVENDDTFFGFVVVIACDTFLLGVPFLALSRSLAYLSIIATMMAAVCAYCSLKMLEKVDGFISVLWTLLLCLSAAGFIIDLFASYVILCGGR